MQGTIALDIDGTITAHHYDVSPKVIDFFHALFLQGWEFIFITGRPFRWGIATVQHFPFPYYLAVQNGAIILKMPEQRLVIKKYLSQDLLPKIEQIAKEEHTDFVVYGGWEYQDECFYRPDFLDSEIRNYVERRKNALGEIWNPIQSFLDLPFTSFPSIKFLAREALAKRLGCVIEQQLNLHAPLVRDPFDKNYFVLQITGQGVDKGEALRDFIHLTGFKGPTIAAGDDYNDYTLLQAADVKVVMGTAPQMMLDLADVIAPPAAQDGIIEGISKAIELVRQFRT